MEESLELLTATQLSTNQLDVSSFNAAISRKAQRMLSLRRQLCDDVLFATSEVGKRA